MAEGKKKSFLSRAVGVVRGGLTITNLTNYDLFISLDQLTPLYWTDAPLKPKESFKRKTNRVWFTVKSDIFRESLVNFVSTLLQTHSMLPS
eukprot:m.152079 g.152079  ORF g.152079 m.152079 type:complete len:91 (-) comp15049_c0_seq1:29-301(-)